MGLARGPVEIVDPRGIDGHLRVSWHPDRRMVNVSQWRGGVCVATTPVGLSEVPALVNLLVVALEEAATAPPAPDDAPTLAGVGRDARKVLTRRLRSRTQRVTQPHLAPVVDLRAPGDAPTPEDMPTDPA